MGLTLLCFMQILRDEASRLAYDRQVELARQLNDSSVSDKLHLCELEPWKEDPEYLFHPCRCGGDYYVAAQDLHQHESIVVACDTCSLCIEVTA